MLNNSDTSSTLASFVQKSQHDDVSVSSFIPSSIVSSTASFIDDSRLADTDSDTAKIAVVKSCKARKTRKRGI